MPRNLHTDFALTTLNNGGGSLNNSATSFVVASSGGTKFPNPSTSTQPNALFIVAIENELILCSGRAADTFTVWSDGFGHTGRGYAGTTAASHTNGVTVVLAVPAVDFDKLWSALPDTFNPDVPPFALGSWNLTKAWWDYTTAPPTPSSYDEEFDGPFKGWGTPWNLSPRPTSMMAPDGTTGTNAGMTASWGTTLKSCLQYQRATNNNDVWYAWRSFTPGGSGNPWTVRCKMSHNGIVGSASALNVGLVVSDQSNLATGPSAGTSVRLYHVLQSNRSVSTNINGTATNVPMPFWLSAQTVTGTETNFSPTPAYGEQYLQIAYDGVLGYRFAVGDGLTYREFGRLSLGAAFTPASVGFRFFISGGASARTMESTVIDWLRTYNTALM